MSSRTCPHCKVRSHFTYKWQDIIQPPTEDPMHPDIIRFCQTCDHCEMPVCGVIMEGNDPDWAGVWPSALLGKDFPDVPKDIAAAANEAHLSLGAKAVRASVMMARATIESTAKERGIQKDNLKSKIDQLAAAGHISEAMKLAAHEIRFAGNEAAHGDLLSEPISFGDADEIVALLDAILERVYQEPARVARIRARREERVRRQVDQESEASDAKSDGEEAPMQ